MKISEIKKEARSKLVQKYPQTLISCFLFLAIVIGLDVILTSLLSLITFNTAVGILVTIIILAVTFPLSFGLVSLFLDYSRNKPAKSTDFINRALLNFTGVCKTTTRLLLKILKYFILGVVIAFLLCLMVIALEDNVLHPNVEQRDAINNVSVAIISLAYTFGIIACYIPYSLSYYVLANNPKTAGKESLEISKEILKNNIGKYVLLYITFIPYGILITAIELLLEKYTAIPEIGTIVGLIGSIMLMPYVLISVTTFFDDINGTKKENKQEEKPKAKKRGRPKKEKSE